MQRQGSIGGSAAIRVRVTGGILLVAHLALVAWLMLRPLNVPWVTPPNVHPLAGIRADLALGWPQAARRIGEGLALLAPLGVLLPMTHGRLAVSPLASLIRTTAAGALISAGIALLQTGVPGRVVDVDSLLLNTAGVLLAHLLVVPASRARLRRRRQLSGDDAEAQTRPVTVQEELSQGRTPTIPRVGIAP
ncbi:VanZ family protein [Streptomyces roseochromogenus]|uniref:Membrane protein n=1 Tax=Streptomyces roseochromogenus subsp. oscitans DS 12.976 TaxID=1352936 RepID=V6KII4_STRRC|nr:VanZ family protein [Streptomyces roseochromogenus]EST31853.1 membrane protein [Streptomyces roseochromogenus subsp. oscitans DS 12.976]